MPDYTPARPPLERLLRDSLRFEWLSGNVTAVRQPHTTGWRTLPGFMCSQLQRGRTVMHLGNQTTLRVGVGEAMVLPGGVLHRIDLVTPTGLSRWVHAHYLVMHNLDLFSLLELPPLIPRKLATRLGNTIEEWVTAEVHTTQHR